MREAVIDVDSGLVDPFGLPVGDPFRWPPPPVLLVLACDVAEALTSGVSVWNRHGVRHEMTVDRRGMATICAGGDQFVYELHPARVDDGSPYDPPLYVAVWPD